MEKKRLQLLQKKGTDAEAPAPEAGGRNDERDAPPRMGCRSSRSAACRGAVCPAVSSIGAWASAAGPAVGLVVELHPVARHDEDLGREAVRVLAVLAPAPGLHLALDVDQAALGRVLLEHVDQPVLEGDDPVPLGLVDLLARVLVDVRLVGRDAQIGDAPARGEVVDGDVVAEAADEFRVVLSEGHDGLLWFLVDDDGFRTAGGRVTLPNPRPFNLSKPSSTSIPAGGERRRRVPGLRRRRLVQRAVERRFRRKAREAVCGEDRAPVGTADGALVLGEFADGVTVDADLAQQFAARRRGEAESGMEHGRISSAGARSGIGAGKPLPPACRTLARQALLLLLYDRGPERRISARRSQTARGVIVPRLSTGMPPSSAIRMPMPVPPTRIAAFAPRNDRIDRPVQPFPQQDRRVPRMQLADGRRTPLPRRMQGRRDLDAGRQLSRRQHPAVRPACPL